MRYELYIDSLIWINFWMNLYLLVLTNGSTLRTATPQRICLGAALGAWGFVIPILCFPYPVIGMCVGILVGVVGMLLFTFRVRRWKSFICLFEQMLLYSFCMGGSLFFLRNLAPVWREVLDSPMGMPIVSGVLFGAIYGIRSATCDSNCICVATLKVGSRMQTVTALIDSGNSLVEPISGKPVCVIDRGIFESLQEENMPGFRVIPYHSVGKKRGIMSGYLLEELEIDYEGMLLRFRNVYVAVSEENISGESKDHSIKIIINPMLFREKRNRMPKKRQNERRNDFKSGNAGKNAV